MAEAAFKFPDEQGKEQEQQAAELEIEIVDDTPPEDRGKEPLPKELVKELEEDDLEEYSEKVKKRLSQMKKVWHDERREKEAARREAEEAFRIAQVKDNEIKKLRGQLGAGEKAFSEEVTKSAEFEITSAKKQLQQAYEEGDPVKIADAQEALTDAKIKLKEAQYRRPPLQEDKFEVQDAQQVQEPQPVYDPRAEAWRKDNTWFGVDEEMTSLALGLHQKLVRQGVDPRSDEYYSRVDEAMKKRFPEYFDGQEPEEEPEERPQSRAKERPRKPATVVAPATRSTAPNKVRLTQTQLAIAKKFRLTPEQYAKEMLKLENDNG
jgi:hypothetical protein